MTVTDRKGVIWLPILQPVRGSMNSLPSPHDDSSKALFRSFLGQAKSTSPNPCVGDRGLDLTKTSTASPIRVLDHRDTMKNGAARKGSGGNDDEGRNDQNAGRNPSPYRTRQASWGVDKDHSLLRKNRNRYEFFTDSLQQANQDGAKIKTLTAKLLLNVKKHRKARMSVTPNVSTPSEKHDSLDNTTFSSSDSKRNVREDQILDFTLSNLQISPPAKASPTSFLTGRHDEVMRTCEHEAAPFQMEIPSCRDLTVTGLLNEFVENYRRIDQNLDLQDWVDRSALVMNQVDVKEHIPIAQLLLECGNDVIIRGFVSAGSDCDKRVEAVIFEGQRHFTVALRGSTEQQARPGFNPTTKHTLVPTCYNHSEIDIFPTFLDEYQKIEAECFEILDKLTEEHPFCDVVFTGHSFGGALATVAAAMYANARPMMRVQCYPMASPKVGSTEFRQLVNSSPNLRVIRLEYGQDGKCQFPSQRGGLHVGHTLVLSPQLGNSSHKIKHPILAYKFEEPKFKMFKTIHPDLRCYVAALEEITRLNLSWVAEFVGTTGSGVVVGDESRQMV